MSKVTPINAEDNDLNAKKDCYNTKYYSKFSHENFKRFTSDSIIFKQNIRTLCQFKNISFSSLFRFLNDNGVNLNRSAFLDFRQTSRQKNWSALVVATFSNALQVPNSLLFSENIIEDFDRYKANNPDTWQHTLVSPVVKNTQVT